MKRSPPSARRLRETCLNIAVARCSLFLSLLLVDRALPLLGLAPVAKPVSELGLTRSANEFGTHLEPGYQGIYANSEFTIHLDINSRGLRGPEVPLERTIDTSRVLAVGDSFTFGQGVEFADSWPHLVEERLAQTRRVEVLNAGWADAGPNGYLAFLRRSGFDYRPDLVLVGFFVGNDVVDDMADAVVGDRSADRVAFRASYLSNLQLRVGTPGVLRGLVDSLFPNLYELGALGLVRMQYLVGGHRDHFDYILKSPPPPDLDEGWRHTLATLQDIDRETRARGARLGVVVIPFLDQVAPTEYDSGHVRDLPQQRTLGFCRDEHLDCLDLLPALRRAGPPQSLYYVKDGHFTPRGTAAAAGAIAEWIVTSGLIR